MQCCSQTEDFHWNGDKDQWRSSECGRGSVHPFLLWWSSLSSLLAPRSRGASLQPPPAVSGSPAPGRNMKHVIRRNRLKSKRSSPAETAHLHMCSSGFWVFSFVQGSSDVKNHICSLHLSSVKSLQLLSFRLQGCNPLLLLLHLLWRQLEDEACQRESRSAPIKLIHFVQTMWLDVMFSFSSSLEESSSRFCWLEAEDRRQKGLNSTLKRFVLNMVSLSLHWRRVLTKREIFQFDELWFEGNKLLLLLKNGWEKDSQTFMVENS